MNQRIYHKPHGIYARKADTREQTERRHYPKVDLPPDQFFTQAVPLPPEQLKGQRYQPPKRPGNAPLYYPAGMFSMALPKQVRAPRNQDNTLRTTETVRRVDGVRQPTAQASSTTVIDTPDAQLGRAIREAEISAREHQAILASTARPTIPPHRCIHSPHTGLCVRCGQ